MSDEIRTTSASGGEKGVKPEQYQSIPPRAMRELAEHFAKGAAKYSDHNFRKGYEWSKSYSALMRHLLAFWGGEDIDEETGSKHIIAVAWHALVLATFMDEHPGYDDRYQPPASDMSVEDVKRYLDVVDDDLRRLITKLRDSWLSDNTPGGIMFPYRVAADCLTEMLGVQR